jgi:hypothetical protein
MSSENSRLRQNEETQRRNVERQQSAQSALEFGSVEEMLRHDSSQNPVPPEVQHRLGSSLAKEPKPQKSWLKKLFG